MNPLSFAAPTPNRLRHFVRVVLGFVLFSLTAFSFAGTWTGVDIGNTGAGGYQWDPRGFTAPPIFSMYGAGSDIQGTADSFRLMYLPVTGDAEIVTYVSSLDKTDPWAKAGAMIRASLDPNSANVAMLLSPAQVCSFQARATTGGATGVVLGPWVTPGYWVKLTRSGNTFTGYISANGTTWTSVGSRDVVMPGQVYAGFAVCSHKAGTLACAKFDAADVNGSSTVPEPPGNVAAENVTPSGIDLTWTDNSAVEDGFKIYRLDQNDREGGGIPQLAGTTGPNVTRFHCSGLLAEHHYVFSVAAYHLTAQTSGNDVYVETPPSPTEPPDTPVVRISSPGPNALNLSWENLVPGYRYHTGFEVERSTAGSPFVVISDLGADVFGFRDTGLTGGTIYSYRVRSVKGALYSEYSNQVTATASGEATPPTSAGWSGRDVGSPALAGSVTGTLPAFTMQAAGSDIYGTADSFQYLAETVTGDTTVVCHVASMTNTNPWAKAGVMIRASLDAGARNVAMLLSPAQACSFQVRAATGNATEVTGGPWVTPPYWVKLTRLGNTLTGYVSANGATWTQVSSRVVSLPAQVFVGFAGTSHNAGAYTTIAFDHAVVTPSTPPPPPAATWTEQNWGGATGSFTTDAVAGTVASIVAASGDIAGSSDSGVFVYRPVTGASTLITRVNSVSQSDPWAKAGLMFRASLDATAANAFVALTPSIGAVFQTRAAMSSAGTVTQTHSWTPGPGSLLKLVRGGGTISAFFSTNNGTTWTPLGSITDDFPETMYAGYATSSHAPSVSTTATFAGP